jgi:hypothetical protein
MLSVTNKLIMLSVVMQNVFMLNVVMLSVVVTIRVSLMFAGKARARLTEAPFMCSTLG